MRKLFLPLCILLLMSGCKKSELDVANSSPAADKSIDIVKYKEESSQSPHVTPPNAISEKLLPEENETTQPSIVPKKIDTIAKKVIKNGNMRIQVGDIKKAQTQVADILKKIMLISKQNSFKTLI